MRILALDVGKGTQDLLLYDTNVMIENSPKMVMPSQTTIVAKRVRAATALGRNIFLYGETMGGGPCSAAIKTHLGLGYSVFATPLAAKTLNDDVNKVSSLGVQITDTRPRESCVEIEMKDVDVPGLRSALKQFDVDLPTTCAVACQDHGESYISNRIFRFQHLSDLIEKGGELTRFAYLDGKIPDYLTRLRAVYRTLKKDRIEQVLIMDTGPAAIFGALYDDVVAKRACEPLIIVNVGNGHTLAAMLYEKRVVGMFEHHTGMLNTNKLDHLLSLFMNGNLTQEWIFEDGGHGCYINNAGFSELNHALKERGFQVTVIGPLREMMKDSKLNPYFAVPGGDMMLTGCFGLITDFLC
ncbi:MAG: DUF1786 domain-containing protein [Halobacteriota archaeon]